MAGVINWKKVAIPSANPDVNHVFVGIDINDDLLYVVDSSGNVTKFTTAAYVAAALANYDLSTEVDNKITTAINNLIAGAPAALDTLDELAQALADDANFASTITNLINGIASDLSDHENDTANPHNVTAAQVGADPAGSAAAVQSNLDTHVNDTGNPHAVTAAQVGAYTTTQTDSAIALAIANLIDSAPGALDTLNELAAALGDDPNFASTVTTALSNKADKTITITGTDGLTGGGDLSANRTISMPNVVTAGSSSGASSTSSITVDAKGRITAFTRTAISIAAAAVTDFASAVRSTVLTGLSTATISAITATDTVLSALGKLQAQVTLFKRSNYLAAGSSSSGIGSSSNAANQRFDIDLTNFGYIIGDTIKIGACYIRGDFSDANEFIDVGFGSSGAAKTSVGAYTVADDAIFRQQGDLLGQEYTVQDIGGGVPGLSVFVSPSAAVNFAHPGMPNGWWWQLAVDILRVN